MRILDVLQMDTGGNKDEPQSVPGYRHYTGYQDDSVSEGVVNASN